MGAPVPAVSRSNPLALSALESCLAHLLEKHRVVVAEGYGDAAWPLGRLSLEPAAVLAVAPGQVVAYNPGKYRAVLSASAELGGGARLEDVAAFIHPEAYFKVPPPGAAEARGEGLSLVVDYVLSKLEGT